MIKKAYVEITNACNMRCSFCPGTSRAPAYMTKAGFAAVLDKLSGNVTCLYFHVMGEPLLHPLVGRFLDMAHGAGLPVNITTNGTLLRSAGEGLLSRPALRQVNISLHSRAGSDLAGDYLEDALLFARKASENGILIAFRLWNMREAGEDEETERALMRIAREYGRGRRELDNRRDGRGAKLAEGVYLNRSRRFEWPDLRGPVRGGGTCMGLRDQVGILSDGTVVPCCLDGEGAVALGNIFLQPLGEILRSPRAVAVAEGFSRRQPVEELCRKCGYRGRFG